MANVLITLIIFTALLVGVVFLQIFLSKKENKWLGLILPAISFVFSLLPVMSVAVFRTAKLVTQTMDEYGRVIEVIENTTRMSSGDTTSAIILMITVFLLYNIPTIILLAIYWGCREKLKKNKELQKMSIQDLG